MSRREVQHAYKIRDCVRTWERKLVLKRGDKLEDDIKMDLKEAGWKDEDFNSCNSG